MKLFSGSVGGSHSLKADDRTENYTSWTANNIVPANGGYGFEDWSLVGDGTRGVYKASSVGQGFGDINDGSGEAWAAYGNPQGNNGINVRRNLPSGLSVGFALSASMAAAYRSPGSKGFNIYTDANWTSQIYSFNIGGDNYRYNVGSGDVNLGWTYDQASVFRIVCKQNGINNVEVTVTRGSDSDTRNVTGVLRGYKFYIYGTDFTSDLHNVFYNQVKVYRY